jgi:hypothetical protein
MSGTRKRGSIAKVTYIPEGCIHIRRKKKIPVVPVSYREKIRVVRSEINFFFEYFFHGFGGFLLGDLQ